MPRLWILSDLHREVPENRAFLPARADADVLVVAGDVQEESISEAIAFVDSIRGGMEAVFVAGNHECWGNSLQAVSEAGRDAGHRHGVHFLDDSFVELAGLMIGGGTFWHPVCNQDIVAAPDLTKIMTCEQPPWFGVRHPSLPYEEPIFVDGPGVMDRRAKNRTIQQRHEASLAALRSRHVDVVVTHYPPTMAALSALPNARIWVHGHIHRRIESRHGDTRIVGNARGGFSIVPDFSPALVVEI